MTIGELYYHLNEYAACFEEAYRVFPFVYLTKLTGKEDNVFCLINWRDTEGQEFSIKLSEGSINEGGIKVTENYVKVMDDEGDFITLSFFKRIELQTK